MAIAYIQLLFVQSPKWVLERSYCKQNNGYAEERVVHRLWRVFGFIIPIHGYQQTGVVDSTLKYGGENVSENTQKWFQHENDSKRNQQHRGIIVDVT